MAGGCVSIPGKRHPKTQIDLFKQVTKEAMDLPRRQKFALAEFLIASADSKGFASSVRLGCKNL